MENKARLHTFHLDQFCNSFKYDKKMVGGRGVISKDLKSSHQTGETFHKSYITMVYSFFCVCFFIVVVALAR